MARRLTVRRETLTELSTDELTGIVAAAPSGKTCPLGDCFEDLSEVLTCVGTPNCPTYTC